MNEPNQTTSIASPVPSHILGRNSIQISHVKIPPRMRKDLGNISALADSIQRHGLIQPIVLDTNFNLVAGERRLRAHQSLGIEYIDFVHVSQLAPDEQAEIEFEENFWQKKFTWQEEAIGIYNIYRKKKTAGALQSFQTNWHVIISDMFGISIGTVNYILLVAIRLIAEQSLPEDKRRYHQFSSINEAYRMGILGERQEAENRRLSELTKSRANTPSQQVEAKQVIQEVEQLSADPDLLAEVREKYEANPLNTVPFAAYWEEKQQVAVEAQQTIYLSNSVVHGSCIEYMLERENMFDHIITDPPYAIDMDMLEQENVANVNTDIVRAAHEVGENLTLLERFFPAAFKCTKEKAFVVLCCDLMVWQHLYDHATKAGFMVQRWPMIWKKINQSVRNGSAGYNTTKDYEAIMVCRKPAATLQKKRNSSVIDASNTEAVKLTGHPFAKPFELTAMLTELVSVEGQLILEPFAGGGSIAIKMLQMNRRVIAIEKEEHHYPRLVENIKNLHYRKINANFLFK